MKKLAFVLMAIAVSVTTMAQSTLFATNSADKEKTNVIADEDDVNRDVYNRVYGAVAECAQLPINELMIKIGEQFLGTEYVGGTLEQVPEQLHVYLNKTDCILFVELTTCFALTVKGLRIVQAGDGETFVLNNRPSVVEDKPSYELLKDNIRNMRYRLGKVDGYASRVHYTSEWILQNQTNGIMWEMSNKLGEEFDQKFYFMSTHPSIYKQLDGDDKELARIQAVEEHLNQQAPYFYVSHKQLQRSDIISQIRPGDIITFVSKMGNGIDLAHVAIAYEVDGVMHFMHASSRAMKVIIEEKTLADYATNGIRVMRMNDVLNAYPKKVEPAAAPAEAKKEAAKPSDKPAKKNAKKGAQKK